MDRSQMTHNKTWGDSGRCHGVLFCTPYDSPGKMMPNSLLFAGFRTLLWCAIRPYDCPNIRMFATRHTGRLRPHKGASLLQLGAHMKSLGDRSEERRVG